MGPVEMKTSMNCGLMGLVLVNYLIRKCGKRPSLASRNGHLFQNWAAEPI